MPSADIAAEFDRWRRWLALLALPLAASGLVAWSFGQAPRLFGGAPMTLVASIALVLLLFAAELLARDGRPRCAALVAAVPLALGALILGGFFEDSARFGAAPAPETGASLLVAGAAILFYTAKSPAVRRAGQVLALLTLGIAVLALTGYFSGVASLYSFFVDGHRTGISFAAATALLLVATVLLFARPELGVMKLLVSSTQGGAVARRLVLAMVATPPIVGWLGLVGVHAGWLTEGMRLALAPFLGSSVLLVVTWFTARRLDTADRVRLAAERELAYSESRLKAVLEVLPVGVWWTDATGRLTQTNPAVRNIWGDVRWVEPEHFGEYRARWADSGALVTADQWALTRAVRKGETSIDERLEIEGFDGSKKTILNSAMPFHDARGRLLGAVAVNLDITERDRFERGLELLAATGRALLHVVDFDRCFREIARIAVPRFADWCMIHVLDRQGCLRRVAAEMGRGELGCDALECFETFLLEPERGAIHRVIRERATVLVTQERRATCPVRCYVLVPVILEGKVIGVLSFFRNDAGRPFVSSEVSLAEDLSGLTSLAVRNARLFEESQRAARAREEVVAVVSHDLKNPIAGVQLAARSIRRSIDASKAIDPEKLRRFADGILSSTATMDRLVRDLLDLSRMEAGKFRIQRAPTDVRVLLADIETSFAALAKERGIDLRVRPPASALVASLDADRIRQLLSNLVGNALKFVPAGGSVDVVATSDGRHLVLEVRDDGPGIPRADLPHLFDRYWQPQQARGRNGAGLGLFICKGIADAHGATLTVESEEGSGARFVCTVPVETST